MSLQLRSRLPKVGTTIFTVMSALAQEHKAINLSQGFPDFDGHPDLKRLVKEHIDAGHNQYAPMAGLLELRKAVSGKIHGQHGHSYDPVSEVCITAGATQAIFTAIMALVHPGDEVIIIEPAYDCYAPAVELAGGIVVRVSFDLAQADLNTKAIAKAITDGTRMLIINTPHNPTGHVISEDSMRWLEKRLNGTDIIVLGDEVYEHIIFDDQIHQSVARFPGLVERSLLISSFGKTFHTTGWKMGYCAAPEPIMKEFKKVHQFNVFCVNRPIQHALAEFLKNKQVYMELNDFYQKKRDFFCKALEGSRFKFKPSSGTYFQLLDYSEIDKRSDIEVAKEWTVEKGIASIPISVFYEQDPDQHFLRFCFAKNEETLEQAAELLKKL
jgi:methionine aminotransferase